MSKKQTTRTLGSIERIQPAQRTQSKQSNHAKQDKPKKLNKERHKFTLENLSPTLTPQGVNKLDLELDDELDAKSDFDIENFSDGNDDVILEKVNLKSKKLDVKKKRVISDDQKKYLLIDWHMLDH